MGLDKWRRIDKIASDYNKTLENNMGLVAYLHFVNPVIDVPKDSLNLKERFEKELAYLSELAGFLASEQVTIGALPAHFNECIGIMMGRNDTLLYINLKQILYYYLNTFSESIGAETSYTLRNSQYFLLEHINRVLGMLSQIPVIIPANEGLFNAYMFMHSHFLVMPNASTDSSRDLFTNLYTDMFHWLPQPAPEYPLSVENTGQYSQEMQAGSPDEGQDSPMYQRSVHQAEQRGGSITVFVSWTFED